VRTQHDPLRRDGHVRLPTSAHQIEPPAASRTSPTNELDASPVENSISSTVTIPCTTSLPSLRTYSCPRFVTATVTRVYTELRKRWWSGFHRPPRDCPLHVAQPYSREAHLHRQQALLRHSSRVCNQRPIVEPASGPNVVELPCQQAPIISSSVRLDQMLHQESLRHMSHEPNP
jgi:hypothetical protein